MRLSQVSIPEIFPQALVKGGELRLGEARKYEGFLTENGTPIDLSAWTLGVHVEAYTADGEDVGSLVNWSLMAPQPLLADMAVTYAKGTARGSHELTIPGTVFQNIVKPAANQVREMPVLVAYLIRDNGEGTIWQEPLVILYRRGFA